MSDAFQPRNMFPYRGTKWLVILCALAAMCAAVIAIIARRGHPGTSLPPPGRAIYSAYVDYTEAESDAERIASSQPAAAADRLQHAINDACRAGILPAETRWPTKGEQLLFRLYSGELKDASNAGEYIRYFKQAYPDYTAGQQWLDRRGTEKVTFDGPKGTGQPGQIGQPEESKGSGE